MKELTRITSQPSPLSVTAKLMEFFRTVTEEKASGNIAALHVMLRGKANELKEMGRRTKLQLNLEISEDIIRSMIIYAAHQGLHRRTIESLLISKENCTAKEIVDRIQEVERTAEFVGPAAGRRGPRVEGLGGPGSGERVKESGM